MFGIGMTEMLLILVVVLIVIGPKRLPEVARALGQGLAEFKRASEEFRNAVDSRTQDRQGAKESPQQTPLDPDRDEAEADEPHSPAATDPGPERHGPGGRS